MVILDDMICSVFFVEFRVKVLIVVVWIFLFVFVLLIFVLFDVIDDNVIYFDKIVILCDLDFNYIYGLKVRVIFIRFWIFLY